ncbi:ovomucoid [Oryctolagus cuniculus]|uniref:ovomucoid n=1 Tax=Oryctolagus cuniculus TaxID=9986 RepID=UPI0038790D70
MANFSFRIKTTFIAMLALYLSCDTVSSFASSFLAEPDCNRYSESLHSCRKMYVPICASNDFTYGNVCAFCKAIRHTNNGISFKHYGPC